MGRHNWEALAAVPPAVKATRFVAEVVHDQQADAAAELQVGRHNWEALAESILSVKTTRFVAEVVHDQQADAAAEVQVGRTNFEALGRSFITPTACTIPNFWRLFAHNWADSFKLETRFRTAISRGAVDLSEDRTQIFERPRRTLKVRWSEKGLDDRRNLQDLIQSLRSWKSEDWVIPLSSDEGCLTENAASAQDIIKGDFTKRRFFVGARVALVKTLGDRGDVQDENGDLAGVHETIIAEKINDTEFRLEDNLPFDVTAFQGYLVPLICVHPRLQDTIKQHHCRLWDIEMEFEERGGSTALPPIADDIPDNFDTYRDIPILRPRHDYSNPLNIEILQEGQQIEIGRDKATFPRGATQRVKHRIRMLEQREKGWDYVRFFESRRGRLKSFWLIDQEMIFDVTDIETTFIDVRKVGDFDEFQVDNEFFGFMLKDGSCFVREIVTFNDLPTAWRMSVADVLPPGLAFQDVIAAGRARPTRMIEDSMQETWFHTDALRFETRTISLLEEKDVTLDP